MGGDCTIEPYHSTPFCCDPVVWPCAGGDGVYEGRVCMMGGVHEGRCA